MGSKNLKRKTKLVCILTKTDDTYEMTLGNNFNKSVVIKGLIDIETAKKKAFLIKQKNEVEIIFLLELKKGIYEVL